MSQNKENLWDIEEILAATNGELIASKSTDIKAVTGVSIDTRKIETGDLFIAIEGDKNDGHQYLAQAVENGAVIALVHKEIKDAPLPLIKVKDTFQGLQDLGFASRARFKGKVIGLTGSVGKTSTKEMLANCLASIDKTHATKGNLNNHFGVPLTLARMPKETKFAVIEMGMNHANEIGPLSRMSEPHVSIITNIAPVHIENFDDIDGIAHAKGEIFLGQDSAGSAVLHADSSHYPLLKSLAQTQGIENILSFGQSDLANAQLIEYHDNGEVSEVTCRIGNKELSFKLGMVGRHQAINTMAVLLAIQSVGVDIEAVLPALATMGSVDGRGNRQFVKLEGGDVTLIDESYNASPEAIKAAISVLKSIKTSGRRIVALADMKELGKYSQELHESLAEFLVDNSINSIDRIYTCGPDMQYLHDKLGAEKATHVSDSSALADLISQEILPNDVVLIKGSRSMKMEVVVDALKALEK